MSVTRKLTVATDFHSRKKNTVEVNATVNCLVPFFTISSFLFNRRKKPIQGWNNLRVPKMMP